MTKQLLGSAPYFFVKDVVVSANYYRDKLGFQYDQLWGEPPCFCMPHRDGFVVMLSQVEGQSQPVPTNRQSCEHAWDAYFWIQDADKLFAEFQAHDVSVVYKPTIQDEYGMKEFAIQDCDGHVLAFGQSHPK